MPLYEENAHFIGETSNFISIAVKFSENQRIPGDNRGVHRKTANSIENPLILYR